MINPELLKCFIAAADTGSFSAAARLLGRRQGTISNNIARLEDELGLILFDRQGKYPQLSEQGAALYDSAKLVVESGERFSRNAGALNQGVPSRIRLGIDEDLPLQELIPVLSAVQRHYPQLQLELLRQSSVDLLLATENGVLDLALAMSLEGQSSGYEFRIVGQLLISFVCGKEHRFARQRSVSNDDLLHDRQLITRGLAQQSHDLHKMSASQWLCQGFDALQASVSANAGWAMLPLFPGQSVPGQLHQFYPDFSPVTPRVQYDLVWPKNRSLTAVEILISEHIQECFRDP